MNLAISYLSYNGTVEAFVLGRPEWRGAGKTKGEAEQQLRSEIEDRINLGELSFLEIDERPSFADRARSMSEEDKQMWREVSEEMRREREAERASELSE